MAGKRSLSPASKAKVFGHPSSKSQPSLRVGLYARVSTHDQHTLPLQMEAMRNYVRQRGWTIVSEIKDVGSGSIQRPKREMLMQAARRRDTDVILVWRLDRWGRSVADLVMTLKELNELGVAFVSLTEALDLTTSSGRAMAGLLAVFAEFEREILRERVKAGLAQARKQGKRLGRPRSAALKTDQVRQMTSEGLSQAEVARRLRIGRTSVRRLLAATVRTRARKTGSVKER
jgi:putative DNA-invertase from lambdoid prophage Rac